MSRLSDKIKETGFYRTKIKDWPEDERPREKLLKIGAENLSDAELIAIILRTGSGDITAVDLAKSMLVQNQNLQKLSERSTGELKKLKGIGDTKAVTLIAAFEIGRRLTAFSPGLKTRVSSPQVVADRYIPLLSGLKQEEFRIVLLDTANHIIGEQLVTKGSLNASIVHPREVFKKAITESAAAIIVLHNHPSGNPEPSKEDRLVTTKLIDSGKVLGIEVVDHLIIAGDKYYSFAEQNEI